MHGESMVVHLATFIFNPSPYDFEAKITARFRGFLGEAFFLCDFGGCFLSHRTRKCVFFFQKMPRHPSEQTPITAYGDGILVVGKQPRASKVIPLMVQKSGDRHLEV